MEDFTEKLARESKNGTGESTHFKKPVLIGKRPGGKSSSKSKVLSEQKPHELQNTNELDSKPVEKIQNEVLEEHSLDTEKKIIKNPVGTSKEQQIPLPYKEPAWSGICSDSYNLETLKNGVIISTEDLSKKPFWVFGRLSNCDFVLEHPSVSRYHTVLQYWSTSESGEEIGWYLYDLKSSHGTFLNKNQIQPNVYHRVHVGHVFKLGHSTRMFILQGPVEDQETELNLTVTELIELRKKRESIINQLENDDEEEVKPSEMKSIITESEGVDWGMGEDAYDENPLAENPFATELDALNEELYLDDPKKTLRGWFEREGYELDYKVEERGFAHFICRVELPVESTVGMTLIAEAVVKNGKKKEAIVQCALEACRMLDRHGLLRQSTHESKRRRRKRLEDEDYYSSDEDTFLDRTGTIEKKREARMKAAGKTTETVETYESLIEKYESVEREIHEVRQMLNEATASRVKPVIGTDDLDAYMSSLQEEMTKKTKPQAKLKARLNQLQLEEVKLRKLVNLTKPALMPELKAPTLKEPVVHSPLEEKIVEPLPKKELEIPVYKPPPQLKKEPESFIKKDAGETKQPLQQQSNRKVVKKNVLGPLLPPELLKQLREESIRNEKEENKPKEQQIQEEDREKTGLVIRKRKKTEPDTETEESKKVATDAKVEYDASDTSKYAMWLPPEDQSGDGKTALNKKLGY